MAAPAARLVGAFGGIESAWPVHGSVLAHDGKVYGVAGRSSFLDGGLFAYALDAATGHVIEERKVRSSHDMDVGTGQRWSENTGTLADILVRHRDGIWMRNRLLFGDPDGSGSTAGGPLHATAGLLDHTGFSRTGWYLGDQPYGDHLVFTRDRVWGARYRKSMSANGGFFMPGKQGFEYFCADRRGSSRGKKGGQGKRPPPPSTWSRRIPVRPLAMALAGSRLLVAGPPDTIDSKDPWAAYDGRRGGVLMVLDAGTGKVVKRIVLDDPPVFGGIAVADGRVFLATRGGTLLCLE
jgi:outer membrane protein assembly factor BamB